MTRRGFTLLETVLAAAIASIVALVALGMFIGVERTNRVLAVRAEQSGDLARTRMVMERAFLNLLMSSHRPMPRRTTPANRNEPPAPVEPEREPTPRLILDADPRLAGFRMTRDEDTREFGVQRLEIVLSQSPVPDQSRDIWAWAITATPAREVAAPGTTPEAAPITEAEDEEAQAPVRAVRGAFEFWPQNARGEQGRLEELLAALGDTPDMPMLWELWWVPLPPKPEYVDDPPPLAPPILGEPYLIASNLRYARWTFYDDREKKVRHAAAVRQHIPAYVELALETGAGLRTEFMFEVDSAVGLEAVQRPAPAPTSPGGGGEDGIGAAAGAGNTPPPTRGGGREGGGGGGGKGAPK
ncbi:MAG: hypothetical protein HBSAPP03_09760 [Phycisphaerae bacterium]|nr:MAG: hypothetical protein HBSAPP03_09760 [Phycisphaerae bacterium]